MMVDVTVSASWRMSRLEFYMPYNTPHMVTGYGEVLFEGSGLSAFRGRSNPRGPDDPPPKPHSLMPGAQVSRALTADVLTDTVTVDGKEIVFATVVAALGAFMEKWRLEDVGPEDIEKP